VSDLVANGRDLADGRLKPLLSVRRTAHTVTNILPNIRLEEQGWDLTEVEVIDDAQRFRSRGGAPGVRVRGFRVPAQADLSNRISITSPKL
jgi:hypothetical protein